MHPLACAHVRMCIFVIDILFWEKKKKIFYFLGEDVAVGFRVFVEIYLNEKLIVILIFSQSQTRSKLQ